MRLQAVWVKIGIGVSLAVSLAACDTAVSADSDQLGSLSGINTINDLDGLVKADSYIAPSDNPCIDSWVIDGIKGNILDSAQEIIENNKGFDDTNQRLLDSAGMSLSYISEPTSQPNGSVSCSANINATYLGNEQTDPDALASLVKSIKQSSFTGYMLGTGINAYNIDDFSDIHDNDFSVKTTYSIGSTYSESGEMSESYHADIGAASSMLALVVMIDRVAQDRLTP
jgi:hypothetical protein